MKKIAPLTRKYVYTSVNSYEALERLKQILDESTEPAGPELIRFLNTNRQYLVHVAPYIVYKDGAWDCTDVQSPELIYLNVNEFGKFIEHLQEQENKEPAKQEDQVNKPNHYNQGKIECIDAIEAATTNLNGIEAFCTGNAIKYLWRWKQKNKVQDLEKAKWYIDRLISGQNK